MNRRNHGKHLDEVQKNIWPRAESLAENEFFLEAIYMRAAVIEYLLQEAIYIQEEWAGTLLTRYKLKLNSSVG